MKKILGILLILAGLIITLWIVYMSFNGKYGMNQFLTDLSNLRGNFSTLSYSFVGLAVMALGLWLVVKKSKK